jgi:hypothetical protein
MVLVPAWARGWQGWRRHLTAVNSRRVKQRARRAGPMEGATDAEEMEWPVVRTWAGDLMQRQWGRMEMWW